MAGTSFSLLVSAHGITPIITFQKSITTKKKLSTLTMHTYLTDTTVCHSPYLGLKHDFVPAQIFQR